MNGRNAHKRRKGNSIDNMTYKASSAKRSHHCGSSWQQFRGQPYHQLNPLDALGLSQFAVEANGLDLACTGFKPFDYEEIVDAVTVPDKLWHRRARHNVAPPVMRCN